MGITLTSLRLLLPTLSRGIHAPRSLFIQSTQFFRHHFSTYCSHHHHNLSRSSLSTVTFYKIALSNLKMSVSLFIRMLAVSRNCFNGHHCCHILATYGIIDVPFHFLYFMLLFKNKMLKSIC